MGDYLSPSFHGAIRPGDQKKLRVFMVVKPETAIQPSEKFMTYRLMPNCDN